jgi:uncharacterized protein
MIPMPTHFTPLAALAGGTLIGVAALVLWLTLGRIAGISGMIGSALRTGTAPGERAWRLAFLLGLIAGPAILSALSERRLVWPSPTRVPVLLVAGLAVGLGTGLANGCTSGHGVCGVARLSRRSIAATAVFLALGFVAASVLRHMPYMP